jgi:hypothetical protein
MNKLSYTLISVLVAMAVSCNKEDDDVIVVPPPSEGETITFNGGVGGPNAANSAYIDFSTEKIDSVKRVSWDLGFYSGADFRVILNNTTGAGAKVLATNDLAAVGVGDTIGLTLAVSQASPAASDFAYFDAIDGNLANTVIPAISAVAADNKVIILNRGTGGGTAPRPWIKLRVIRNASGGYAVQYGLITQAANFQTVDIPKDPAYHFKYVSLDNGAIVNVEPKKAEWDLSWGYSVFQTNFGAGLVPYNFSDLINVNHLAGVQACEKVYSSATVRNDAFTVFNKDSLATVSFSADRWSIGSKWRSTQPATGVRTERFYVVKDPAGNTYKVKFISMGVNDGGERGKPQFEYKLIK